MGSWKEIPNGNMFLKVVFILALSANWTSANDPFSGPIRNGKGELCAFTATEPGRYQLSGLAKRPWHQPYCTVYIRGPPQTRIRLTFDIDRLDCKTSILSVYDGWRIFDWLKKKHYSLPEDTMENNAEKSRRQIDLCSEDTVRNGVQVGLETSQNAGQIFYRLARVDSVVVTVEFIDNEQACSVFISDEVDGLYKISNGGKAGVCKWYVSGAIIVTLDEVHLRNSSQSSCDESNNFFQFQSSSITWRVSDMKLEQKVCQPEKERLDYLLPCKYNRIELHTDESLEGTEQYVTFSLQRPSDSEKEPHIFYCY